MDHFIGIAIALLLLAGLVGALIALARWWSSWHIARRGADPILLAFDFDETEEPDQAAPTSARRLDWTVRSHDDEPRPVVPVSARGPQAWNDDSANEPASSLSLADQPTPSLSLTDVEDPPAVEGKTIRFHQPSARTMRLLPGRLEVEEGEDHRAEIRFVDLPGAPPEVTFGRSRGEPFRHIQLHSPTVSREHARMIREGDDWEIENRSQTNPIVVNGRTLRGPGERRTLRDRDRIEMGEVVFRYYRA
jgi:pSer/pThr/pTyr-binding forkhead associated (FHA) protein